MYFFLSLFIQKSDKTKKKLSYLSFSFFSICVSHNFVTAVFVVY